jgi:hypothetical protein
VLADPHAGGFQLLGVRPSGESSATVLRTLGAEWPSRLSTRWNRIHDKDSGVFLQFPLLA